MRSKRGQVTIFIIIAIVLVASVAGFVMFKKGLFHGAIPSSIKPVYNSFLSCVEDKVWVDYAESVEEAGADALELNLSCPMMFLSKEDVSEVQKEKNYSGRERG